MHHSQKAPNDSCHLLAGHLPILQVSAHLPNGDCCLSPRVHCAGLRLDAEEHGEDLAGLGVGASSRLGGATLLQSRLFEAAQQAQRGTAHGL